MNRKFVGRAVGFPPIVDEKSEILILGTLPSVRSIEHKEYYAHPQNHFWPIMETIFKVKRSAPYRTRCAALLARRIALWDILRSAEREGSSDTKIKKEEANEIHKLLKSHPRIRTIVFNGNNAYKITRRVSPGIFSSAGYKTYVMPSTSPRNAGKSLKEKTAEWRKVVGGGEI